MKNSSNGLAAIRSALLTRGEVEETLKAELRKAGLQGKSKLEWRPGVIALSGEIADKDALTKVIEAVREALASPITFQLTIASGPEMIYVGETAGETDPLGVPSLDLAPGRENPFGERIALRSVAPVQEGGAGLPFITTSDGAVYFLGGILPSGHTLTGIYTDRLEFSRKGSSMAYKLQRR